MNVIMIIVRAFTSVAKLSVVLVQFGFLKRSAIKHFRKQLVREGLPDQVVKQLTDHYADMVSLNPMTYAKLRKINRA